MIDIVGIPTVRSIRMTGTPLLTLGCFNKDGMSSPPSATAGSYSWTSAIHAKSAHAAANQSTRSQTQKTGERLGVPVRAFGTRSLWRVPSGLPVSARFPTLQRQALPSPIWFRQVGFLFFKGCHGFALLSLSRKLTMLDKETRPIKARCTRHPPRGWHRWRRKLRRIGTTWRPRRSPSDRRNVPSATGSR